jgi:Fic family protein
MLSFRDRRLATLALPPGTVGLLTDIAESRARQSLLASRSPRVLDALLETALVQSVESSNRIEGITVSPDRLRPLVVGDARPRTRSEEEIQGYRKALRLVHASAASLTIVPDLLLRLHGIVQEGAGDAGQWKRIDNEIVELPPVNPAVDTARIGEHRFHRFSQISQIKTNL